MAKPTLPPAALPPDEDDGGDVRIAYAAGDGPAERKCLSCDTVFASEGWHNRLCRRCARRGQAPP